MEELWCAELLILPCCCNRISWTFNPTKPVKLSEGNFGVTPPPTLLKKVHELSGMWHTALWLWMATHRCCWQCQSWMVCLWTNGYLAVIPQGICWFIGWGVPRVCWVGWGIRWKDNRRPMLNTQNAPSGLERTFGIERLDWQERHDVQTWKGFPTC